VSRGLVVYPKVIESQIAAELPFMATEEILMAAVRGGGDRQVIHEALRRHAIAAAEQVKQHGRPNDLLERLRSDEQFAQMNWGTILDAAKFVGRAPQQVERFLRDAVNPVRAKYASELAQKVELRV
jgi:adenylosuccinate lyase